MPRAWICTDNPQHRPFLQTAIEAIQEERPWARRGIAPAVGENGYIGKRIERFACPLCCAEGLPGFVRPATATEAARIAA